MKRRWNDSTGRGTGTNCSRKTTNRLRAIETRGPASHGLWRLMVARPLIAFGRLKLRGRSPILPVPAKGVARPLIAFGRLKRMWKPHSGQSVLDVARPLIAFGRLKLMVLIKFLTAGLCRKTTNRLRAIETGKARRTSSQSTQVARPLIAFGRLKQGQHIPCLLYRGLVARPLIAFGRLKQM